MSGKDSAIAAAFKSTGCRPESEDSLDIAARLVELARAEPSDQPVTDSDARCAAEVDRAHGADQEAKP